MRMSGSNRRANPMAREKRGNPRKSRRAKLLSASYAGTTRFVLADDQWRQIEKALSYRLTSADTQELIQVVDRYFRIQPFEVAAPFVSDAHAHLQSVLTKGHDFVSTFSRRTRTKRLSACSG